MDCFRLKGALRSLVSIAQGIGGENTGTNESASGFGCLGITQMPNPMATPASFSILSY
jgi:hypothetical protein